MPIKKENRAKYPDNWADLREQVLERAGHRCEGWIEVSSGVDGWAPAGTRKRFGSDGKVHLPLPHLGCPERGVFSVWPPTSKRVQYRVRIPCALPNHWWVCRHAKRPHLVRYFGRDEAEAYEQARANIARTLHHHGYSEGYRAIDSWRDPIQIVLTIAHVDHDPTHNDLSNLRALCQRCHNVWDAPHRDRNRAASRDKESGQGGLFDEA